MVSIIDIVESMFDPTRAIKTKKLRYVRRSFLCHRAGLVDPLQH